MSVTDPSGTDGLPANDDPRRATGFGGERRRPRRSRTSVLNRGEAMQWITGGGLVLGILMILGLMTMIIVNGLTAFWPQDLERVTLADGRVYLGETWREEAYETTAGGVAAETDQTDPPPEDAPPAADPGTVTVAGQEAIRHRTLLRTGNHELMNTHFTWVEHAEVTTREHGEWDLVIERMEKGRFYGTPVSFTTDGAVVKEGPEASWAKYIEWHPLVVADLDRIYTINKVDIGRANARIRQAEVAVAEAAVAQRTRELRPQLTAAAGGWSGVLAAVLAAVLGLALWYCWQADEATKRHLGTSLAVIAGILLAVLGLCSWYATRPTRSAAVVQADLTAAQTHHREVKAEADALIKQYEVEKAGLEATSARHALVVRTIDGVEKAIPLAMIDRAYAPNRQGFWGRFGVYCSRWWEYLSADPREANSAGGIFPVILGTVVMTLLMTIIAVPFGVLAALYLREYATGGVIVSAIRISINNLAGVPSIVFGVFGLGFFCYGLGGWLDGGPGQTGVPGQGLSVGTWLAALAALGTSAMLAVIGGLGRKQHDLLGRGSRVGMALTGLVLGLDLVVTWLISPWLAGIMALLVVLLVVWPGKRQSHKVGLVHRVLDRSVILMWTKAALLLGLFIWGNPFFTGFYAGELPNPHYGKGGVLWASLTLALLTLPVVIVATEEALAAVPNSMRHGSYACGASKWQTIRRIVLPRATPGILTGTILAMARGAGEVAPLMLVGAVNMAPELPVNLFDWSGSFAGLPLGPLHPDRSFMHLGFHVYDLAMQSPNAEAAKPMVFTTTLLLILIVASLNLSAIAIRSRIRRKFVGEKV